MGQIIRTETITSTLDRYTDVLTVKQLNKLACFVLRQVYTNVSRGEDVLLETSGRGIPKVLFKVFIRDFNVKNANAKSQAKQPRRAAERARRKLRLTLKKDLKKLAR